MAEPSLRALVWHGGDHLRLEELPEPERPNGQVVLDIALTGICGSDLHPYRGHPGPRMPPLVLGHEAVGRVDGREGRFVLNPLVACGECRSCRRGEPQLCEQRGLVGMDRQGVFAERISVDPSALVPVPAGVPDEAAVLTEPLATAVSALRLERIDSDATLGVIGVGPIGLLTVYAATQAGVRVVAAEPLEHRRGLARRLGAAEVVTDANELDAGSLDAVVDAVGVESTWRAGIRLVRSGGSVCIVGLGEAEGAVPVADLVRRGITVRGHFAYSPADFEAALSLLASSPPPLDDWVTVVPLERGADGFRRLVDEPDRYTKVLVSIGGEG
jgi:threonine dehydrogenase-like Zn-dependent dehydrogenase